MHKLKSVHNLLISKNAKAFYNHTNYLLGRNNHHDILIKDINYSEYLSDKNSCNKCCEYNCASVFKPNSNNIATFLPRNNLLSQIEDICFNCDDILKITHDMNDTKSHGPDNFSCFLNKKAASSFELPQSLLFQCFVNEIKLPDIRKTACIVPLYKGKATHNEIVNYRPLSLISIVCKIMQ